MPRIPSWVEYPRMHRKWKTVGPLAYQAQHVRILQKVDQINIIIRLFRIPLQRPKGRQFPAVGAVHGEHQGLLRNGGYFHRSSAPIMHRVEAFPKLYLDYPNTRLAIMQTDGHASNYTADSRLTSSQWETALLCNDVSYWLGTSLESVL